MLHNPQSLVHIFHSLSNLHYIISPKPQNELAIRDCPPRSGGIGNLGLTEEFHNYYALPVLKNQVRGHAGLAAASTAAAAAKASAEAAASTPVASIQHIIKAQQEQEKKAKLYG